MYVPAERRRITTKPTGRNNGETIPDQQRGLRQDTSDHNDNAVIPGLGPDIQKHRTSVLCRWHPQLQAFGRIVCTCHA